MKYVYLAGPIAGYTFDDANNWRYYVQCSLIEGVTGINPLRAKSKLQEFGTLGASKSDYGNLLWCRPSEVTARDRYDCMNADLVLMHFPRQPNSDTPSVGSLIEVGWADAARVPIVFSGFEPFKGHPMMEDLVAFKCKDLDQAIEVCNGFLRPYVG